MKVVLLERLGASLVLVAAFSLSACGGGGGGDTTPPPVVPSPPPVEKWVIFSSSNPTELLLVQGGASKCTAITATAGAAEAKLTMSETAVPLNGVTVAKAVLSGSQLCLTEVQPSIVAKAGDSGSIPLTIVGSYEGYTSKSFTFTAKVEALEPVNGKTSFAFRGAENKFPFMAAGAQRNWSYGANVLQLPAGVVPKSVEVDGGIAVDFTDKVYSGLGTLTIADNGKLDADSVCFRFRAELSVVEWVPACKATNLAYWAKLLTGDHSVVVKDAAGKQYRYLVSADLGSRFNPFPMVLDQVFILEEGFTFIQSGHGISQNSVLPFGGAMKEASSSTLGTPVTAVIGKTFAEPSTYTVNLLRADGIVVGGSNTNMPVPKP